MQPLNFVYLKFYACCCSHVRYWVNTSLVSKPLGKSMCEWLRVFGVGPSLWLTTCQINKSWDSSVRQDPLRHSKLISGILPLNIYYKNSFALTPGLTNSSPQVQATRVISHTENRLNSCMTSLMCQQAPTRIWPIRKSEPEFRAILLA